MTPSALLTLLTDVQAGTVAPDEACHRVLQVLRQAPFEDLGFARVDHHRAIRQGFPEVILGAGKSPGQIAAIAERIVAHGHSLLVTRTDQQAYAAVAARIPGATYHPQGGVITLRQGDSPKGRGTVMVAAAGTSDLAVAEEAALTAEMMGNPVDRLYDVGVAGIHRLLSEHDRLLGARVIIAVAGMEGALASVVGGLVDVPVIAVPTSVGYGASFGGLTALLAMLNSCANGIAVVNIDNGFGAAAMASVINHLD
ncbi:MAG: nickel pincer cofactor biosynthesis protein LarB [Acidobacteria bacterium]|nr:nickel pincer cofactor biosynthesis protein LarB [Acidobacteriota bacterium]